MSFMIEVFYLAPVDRDREAKIAHALKEVGGELTYREVPAPDALSKAVCLTFEFSDYDQAEQAVEFLYGKGVHVEGPVDYG